MTISTDMCPSWRSKFEVQVISRKFESQYKFQVPSTSRRFVPKLWANSCRTANSPIKLTMNCTHAKKHKLKLTQQKREEQNSAETIHIWNTESRTINTIIWYSMLTITIRNYCTNPITCNCTNNTSTMYFQL